MSYITNLQIQNDEHGRFGNQLFRIATVYGVAKSNNADFVFPGWKHSSYFESEHLFNAKQIKIDNVYSEISFGYNNIPFFNNSNLEIRGYFQSEKYFKHCKQEIQNLFRFKNSFAEQTLEKISMKKNCCSIHFRHGDQYDRNTGGAYIDCQDRHPIMTPLYYQNSIELMKNNGVEIFYIFYDHALTRKWIEENINLNTTNHIFIEETFSGMESFYLMSICDHNIIANSSYSWWSAWLNTNNKKIVISPTEDNWFGPTLSHLDTRDLIPNEWIKINNFR